MASWVYDALRGTDTVIIGAGVIGLAIASELAPSRSVVLLEQESRFGEHLSSRNSEVIHAGLYYPPDSLKARLCLRGNALLYQYCQEQQIPYQQCGKLIVASQSQQEALDNLYRNAMESGATGLHRCNQSWLRQQEPWLQASEALLSEHSGIRCGLHHRPALPTEDLRGGRTAGRGPPRHGHAQRQCRQVGPPG